MKNQFMYAMTMSILIIAISHLAMGHNHKKDDEVLECYSCVYVQSKENLTNTGCELKNPPEKYKKTDCFGFGNIQVAGGLRHTSNNGTQLYHAGEQSKNVHCVKISGYTESGVLVIMRGCESLRETNETIHKEKCYKKNEFSFIFPGEGYVRAVEKCYCHGEGCNSSPGLISSLGLSLFMPVLIVFSTVFKV